MASSLYFLHYQSPDDETLLQPGPQLDNAVSPILEDAPASLPRKPLPQEQSKRMSPAALGRAERKPLPALSAAAMTAMSQQQDDDPESRPPLPPRTPTASLTDEINSLSIDHVPQAEQSKSECPPAPPIHRRPLGPRAPQSASSVHRKAVPSGDTTIASVEPARNSYPPSASRSTTNAFPLVPGTIKGFSVTVIRRDPTSGLQWNIGEITSRPSQTDSNTTLSIEISTPGYGQFCGHRATVPLLGAEVTDSLPNTSTTFHREVQMSNISGNFWDQIRARSGSDLGSRSTPSSLPQSQTRASMDATRSMHPLPQPVSIKPKPKGYVFTSPWSGRCEFITGTSGRSLKCKHTLPNFAASSSPEKPVVVSELRFNIPTAEIFGATPKTFGLDTNAAMKKFKPKMREIRDRFVGRDEAFRSDDDEESSDAEDEDETDGKLDLSLGQEKAGGGNRGKRAKLGKLIIHDEGLKMLDLVVAANMGVWWVTWER